MIFFCCLWTCDGLWDDGEQSWLLKYCSFPTQNPAAPKGAAWKHHQLLLAFALSSACSITARFVPLGFIRCWRSSRGLILVFNGPHPGPQKLTWGVCVLFDIYYTPNTKIFTLPAKWGRFAAPNQRSVGVLKHGFEVEARIWFKLDKNVRTCT